jgi:hypothetical protein
MIRKILQRGFAFVINDFVHIGTEQETPPALLCVIQNS